MLSFTSDAISYISNVDLYLVIYFRSKMKYAVFGDSYVARFERSKLSLGLPGEVQFFGRGGMRVSQVPNAEWRRLLDFAPDYVMLHIGGNDLGVHSVPRTVADGILTMVEELRSAGAMRVFVCEVVPRGCVSRSPGLTLDCFERQRKSLNQILHRALGHCYVPLHFRAAGKDGVLHSDYASDRVHFSDKGMVRYRKTLRRAFLHKC